MQSHFNTAALFTVKVALHLRWLTTEKFQNYETVKGGCIPSKRKFKTQKNNKLRGLASDFHFKLLHTGCWVSYRSWLTVIFHLISNAALTTETKTAETTVFTEALGPPVV